MRRVATAAVLLTVLVAALFLLPPGGIALLIALIVALGGYEWALLCGLGRGPARFYATGMASALLLLLALQDREPVFLVAAAFWSVAAPAWLAFGMKAQQRPLLLGAGAIVLLPPALAMVQLSPGEVLLVLGVVWIADTAAYYAGMRWGRLRLAPSISPGKTWEGAAGGLVGVAAYAMILSVLLAGVEANRMAVFLGAAALLVVVSIIGDLFESAAKRQAGVKDSGAILPGHGGILDRIDSATAVLPVAALLLPFLRGSA